MKRRLDVNSSPKTQKKISGFFVRKENKSEKENVGETGSLDSSEVIENMKTEVDKKSVEPEIEPNRLGTGKRKFQLSWLIVHFEIFH